MGYSGLGIKLFIYLFDMYFVFDMSGYWRMVMDMKIDFVLVL